MNIAEWLQGLGLEQYSDVFEENGIDFEILTSISGDDLKEAGVKAVGHRRKMLDAIEALKSQDQPVAEPESAPAKKETVTERRQISMLFCDIVGSTEIVSRSDPEEIRDLIASFFAAIEAAAKAHSGHIGKRLGDGALVYFGFPHALENNAEAAVRAGLGMIDNVKPIFWPDGTDLRIRVGIATGTVIIGDAIGHGNNDDEVMGDAVHLAARLQSLANPGEVMVDGRTRRLLGGLMQFEEFETDALKGFSEPQKVARVLGVSTERSRFAALRSGRMSAFVGRDDNLAGLKAICQDASAGAGKPVLITGEAGVGKSRLVHELTSFAADHGMAVMSWFCSPGDSNSAYAPIIGHYSQQMRACDHNIDSVMIAGESDEAVDRSLFKRLLSLPDDGEALAGYSPQRLRTATIDLIVGQIARQAASKPVLLVLEDYHWVDPSTAEILEILGERTASERVVVIATSRPDNPEPWGKLGQAEQIRLDRIGREASRAIIDEVSGEDALDPARVEDIIDKAEGIPLFVEELARLAIEQKRDAGGDPGRANQAVPDTLRDALMARVDRLHSLRKVIQAAALIGRSFNRDLLEAVVERPSSEVNNTLQSMEGADIIVSNASKPGEYFFQHALLQDVLASALLRSERVQVHKKIAEVLVSELPEKAHPPERIAQHFAAGGEKMQAVGFYVAAAQAALERFANAEAVGHLDKALELSSDAPTEEVRNEAELGIQTLRGLALMMMYGWAADQVGEAYGRAHALWEQTGANAPDKFPIAMGMLSYTTVRGNLRDSEKIAQEALDIAERAESDELILAAEHEYGAAVLYQGKFEEAEAHLDRCVALYKPGDHDAHVAFCGKHQVVSGLGHLGMTYASTGRIKESLATTERALELAEQVNHPFSHSFAALLRCSNLRMSLEPELIVPAADFAFEAGTQQEYPHVIAQAMVLKGWGLGMQGRVGEALVLLTQGVDMWNAMGARLGLPQYTAILGEMLHLDGHSKDGLDTVEVALAMQNETGEFMLEPEILRTKGDIQKALGSEGDVLRETYGAALASAERLKTPHYGLRALARLADIESDYRPRLAEVLAGGTGFASEWLLKEAKAVLG